jgi:lysophospholipase L1-like esterase
VIRRILFHQVARLFVALTCLAGFTACGSPNQPSGTPPSPIDPLVLTCPSDIRVEDVKTPTQVVTYNPATPAGGVEPISITCSPASGAELPLGPTTVSCRGTDSATPVRTATCTFVVTVVPRVPVIGLTKFMAYGDSITAGEINDFDTGSRCPSNIPVSFGTGLFSLFFRPFDVQPEKAYPALLQQLLKVRYTTQEFTVKNEGLPLDDTGNTARFAAALQANKPEAVLFLQGVIDLSGEAAIPSIIANIDRDIAESRRQGVKAFFLSTLTPVLDFSRGCFLSSADIRAVNDEIRALAKRDDVSLVDSWSAFKGNETKLIGGDGLHPSVEGQRVLADTFLTAIEGKLELASVSAFSSPASGRPRVEAPMRPPQAPAGRTYRR